MFSKHYILNSFKEKSLIFFKKKFQSDVTLKSIKMDNEKMEVVEAEVIKPDWITDLFKQKDQFSESEIKKFKKIIGNNKFRNGKIAVHCSYSDALNLLDFILINNNEYENGDVYDNSMCLQCCLLCTMCNNGNWAIQLYKKKKDVNINTQLVAAINSL
jgi:hypothetical protein